MSPSSTETTVRLVAWNLTNVGVTVYRTRDGGRTWQGRAVTTHTQNAGAIATVQFLNPRRGWLVSQEPTAPRPGSTAVPTVVRIGGSSTIACRKSHPSCSQAQTTRGKQAVSSAASSFTASTAAISGHERNFPVPATERSAKAMYGPPVFFGHTILAPGYVPPSRSCSPGGLPERRRRSKLEARQPARG